MRYYLIFSFLFLFLQSQAQFFQTPIRFSAFYQNEFNPEFIHQNNIKQVKITYSSKADNERIKESLKQEITYFDKSGLPEKKNSINANDSIETFYYYTANHLTILREFNSGGINTFYFSYDSAANLTKVVQCKEENATDSKHYFRLKKQEVQWLETYTYEQISPKQIRKKISNDVGAVYKEAFLYLNEKGKALEENERFVVTGVSQNFLFSYSEEGAIKSIDFATDVVGKLEENYTFTYDSKGNRASETFFRNHEQRWQKTYFYDAKQQFPEAIILKYPNQSTFYLQTFKVEFY